jgi:hypothetical protein
MSEHSTDVPYNRSTSVYLTCQSVLDGHVETPYNAVECAYLTPVEHGVFEVGGIHATLPVIHTLDELDLPLHEYIRAPTAVATSAVTPKEMC